MLTREINLAETAHSYLFYIQSAYTSFVGLGFYLAAAALLLSFQNPPRRRTTYLSKHGVRFLSSIRNLPEQYSATLLFLNL